MTDDFWFVIFLGEMAHAYWLVRYTNLHMSFPIIKKITLYKVPFP